VSFLSLLQKSLSLELLFPLRCITTNLSIFPRTLLNITVPEIRTTGETTPIVTYCATRAEFLRHSLYEAVSLNAIMTHESQHLYRHSARVSYSVSVVACIEKPSCSQHVFSPFLVNSTETRLTRFPASRLDRTNAFDFFDIFGSCIRKGSAAWKSNAPRLIRSVPSSNLLQICNTESSCNRSMYEKEDDEFVKTKL